MMMMMTAYLCLPQTLAALGRPDEALADLQKAVELGKSDRDGVRFALLGRAGVNHDLGRYTRNLHESNLHAISMKATSLVSPSHLRAISNDHITISLISPSCISLASPLYVPRISLVSPRYEPAVTDFLAVVDKAPSDIQPFWLRLSLDLLEVGRRQVRSSLLVLTPRFLLASLQHVLSLCAPDADATSC